MHPRFAQSRWLSIVLCGTLLTAACSQMTARRKPGSDLVLPASGNDLLRSMLTMQCDFTRIPASRADSTRAAACKAGSKDTTSRVEALIGKPTRPTP